MPIRVALNHRTYYQYDRPITLSSHTIRLRPAVHSRTPIKSYSLKIEPANHFINWQQDAFGNFLARIDFPEKTDHFSFEVDLVADMVVVNPFDFFLDDYAEHFPFKYEDRLIDELTPYLKIKQEGPLLKRLVGAIDTKKQRTVDFLVMVNRIVEDLISYNIRLEPGVQTCEETLESGTGSCRDSAYLLVQIFRHLGLAARFVSGYLVQLKQDEESLDGPSGAAEDFTDLHAWAEVFVPGAGWIGLDATSGLFAGEGHIPLACTPEPESAAPVVGGMEKCEVLDFQFHNEVTRIHEDPRVTKPYSDTQWQAIDALGEQVDSDLLANDVRLSMGGEPTFISIDDMEGDEWNTTADSVAKRKLALNFMARLQPHFAEKGLRFYGQGKWYPGEVLPRWSFDLIWRKDGAPMWRDQRWLDSPEDDSTPQQTNESAQKFAQTLAKVLKLDPNCILPGYEDKYYMLWQESNLPLDQDARKADLDDPLDRQYLAKHLSKGVNEPTNFVLPLKWNYKGGHWDTTPWEFRRETMYLLPGGSAAGLRLPLASLDIVDDPDSVVLPRSPMEDAPELESPFRVYFDRLKKRKPLEPRPAALKNSTSHAMSLEVRNGKLHLFFPPVDCIEHYIDLLGAVEAVATFSETPVIIEGYEVPYDNGIERIKFTPDPGVIEINVHPTTRWSELRDLTTTLYHEARQSRLGTEKFMVDGRHTGTGGGNHVTLGGLTPSDSPFLRRPGLLRSMITYWQHHPGLSYLFSGTFIGPTSQAPRIDEGLSDRLFELDIAFQQLPESADVPWTVDRVLRNLLTDLTGNTHRAEFCIDKLFSPDSATGRLGILELRAFEMPPHAQMSLVQMLLIRSLVSKFWQMPHHRRLVRWDTELHDRFLLPHFVQEDLREVVADLQQSGYAFQLSWLDPFFEFRFPVQGRVTYDGVEIELRMALEPWNVLGEESSSSGTARYVDSSVERLQVKVTGLTKDRHVLTCNGRRLPLRPTGRNGEYVAGVRYKAWSPWSALHPTIGVQTPLHFDIVDTWNSRSIGGCSYHVGHPGGRSYETIPVNAYEAEARRNSRFSEQGHTPGPIDTSPMATEIRNTPSDVMTTRLVQSHPPLPVGVAQPVQVPEEDPTKEFPLTLDLRMAATRS